jgi:hypothetical protein
MSHESLPVLDAGNRPLHCQSLSMAARVRVEPLAVIDSICY